LKLDTLWPALAIGVATVGIGIAIWKYEAPVVPADRRYAPGAPGAGTELMVVEPFLATRELADLDQISSPTTRSDPAGVEGLIASGEALRLEPNDRIVVLELCGVEHSFARRARVRTPHGEFWTDAFNVMTPYRTRPAEQPTLSAS
jgi:hypothetical protein